MENIDQDCAKLIQLQPFCRSPLHRHHCRSNPRGLTEVTLFQYLDLNIASPWTRSNSSSLSLCFCLSPLPLSLSLSPAHPSTPRVPKPVNQQIVNEGPSSKTQRERGRGGTEWWDREEFWTNCLFVKTCPPVCLFACLLLWCESLNELPARTTTQRLLFGFPFHVPLNVNEKETKRQPERVRERLITCFNNGD